MVSPSSKIKKYYISHDIWIDKYRNNDIRSKILLKLILKKYDNNLID